MNAALAVLCLLTALHDEKSSSSRVQVRDDGVTWAVDLSLQGLSTVLPLPADPVDLSERRLQAFQPEIVKYLRTCMTLKINGTRVEGEPVQLEPVYETFVASGEKYIAHFWITFRYPSAAKVETVDLSAAFFATRTREHRAVLSVTWDGGQHTYARSGPFDLDLTARRVKPTFWSTFGDFVVWGMHHIFIGYDHIAFLLALLLGAKRLGEVVKIATSFTVAHSITLLLAAKEVIHLPSNVTESLIAASIVYVAVENYFLKEAKYRWVLTFVFGLVHGLGFSGALGERLQDLNSIVVPVLSFNVGVELGQVAILLVAFPLMAWIRKAATEEAAAKRQLLLVRVGSAPILLLGCFWLLARIFQKDWPPFIFF